MCEAVENYAKEYAKECIIRDTANIVKNIMKNTKRTLQEALDIVDPSDEDRKLIIEQISEGL